MAEKLEPIACRLPKSLIDDARRYADLYHSDVSKLLREGLRYRLAFKSWPPIPARDMIPGSVPPHLAGLLQDLSTHLGEVRRELADARATHGQTPQAAHRAYNGITTAVESLSDQPAEEGDHGTAPSTDDPQDMPLPPEPASDPAPTVPGPDFDRKKYRLGEPCKVGHCSHGEAGNLKELISGLCVACAPTRKAARTRRQAARGGQEGAHV